MAIAMPKRNPCPNHGLPSMPRWTPTPLAKGNYYLSNKQYHQALLVFKELVEKEPSNNYVFRSLALAWNGLDQFNEGEAYLKDYLSIHPMSDSAMYGLGFLYYLDGRWNKSEEFLNKAIASNPGNAFALNNMGAVYAQQKKFSKAEAIVKKAIGHRPSELMFYENLFGVYKRAGATGKFAIEFHQLLKKNSTDVTRGYGITLLPGDPHPLDGLGCGPDDLPDFLAYLVCAHGPIVPEDAYPVKDGRSSSRGLPRRAQVLGPGDRYGEHGRPNR